MGQAWRGSQARRKSRLLKLRAQNCPHLLTVCVVGEGGRGVAGLRKGEQKSLESQGEPSPVSGPEDPTVELTEVGASGPAESLGSLQPPPPLLAAGVRGEREQGGEGSQAASPGVSALTPLSVARQQTEFSPGEGVGGS